jgi:5S rRNA maturation endonuclease (ribonuclease M5)
VEGKKFSCQVYPLEQINKYLPNDVTYVVEGFKDVLRMLSMELQAVCFTNGANAIPKDLTPISHLKKFIVMLDNDVAGEKGQLKVAHALKGAFPIADVLTTDWKELNESFTSGTDVSDVSDATVGDLITTDKPYYKGYKLMTVEEMLNSDIPVPLPIVEHLIVEKGVTIFAATDGVGKSLLALQLGFSITRGVPFMGYFEIVNPRPVLLLNYELPDGAVRERMGMQNKHFSQYPEKHRLMINTRDKKTIYADLWDDINTTITENIDWLRGGVVLIDNMYSTSDKDLSKNRDCKDYLQNIEPLKWEQDISVGLIAHYTKEWQKTYSTLTKYPIEGGKTVTNYIDNGMVMGESELTPGLRIGKIIKTRSSYTPLKDIPFKMHFDMESWTFEKGVIINNEAVHFQPPKSRQEVDALKDVEKTIHQKHPNDGRVFFGFDAFKDAHLNVTGKESFSTSTVYEWLKRLKEWGYIAQPYEGVWKVVPETLEDES